MDGVLDKNYAVQRLRKKYLAFRYRERALVAVSMIKKFLPAAEISLVDFGAAEGLTLLEMHRLLPRGDFTGIEYDRGLIESAPVLPDAVVLRQGDVMNLREYADNSVDVVTALALLEHLGDPTAALLEARRILKPGGILIATCPSPFWDHVALFFGAGKEFGGEHHVIEFDKNTLLRTAVAARLDVERYFRFMFLPIAYLPYLKISVSPSLAWAVDRIVARLKLFDWLFVNQCIVLRRGRV